jgi:transcriptional regulator with XRE-family HTH domain
MIDYRNADNLGDRVQAARRMRGIRSRQELVDRIGHGSVTEPILANIEGGRKGDLSVSQLLNIAFALQLSPSYLLAPMGNPTSQLDLPNLTPELANLTPRQLDAWLSGTPSAPLQWGTVDEESERHQLAALRELDLLLRERRRLSGVLALEAERPPIEAPAAERALWESTEDRLAETELRIEQLTKYLGSAGWMVDEWTSN